MQDIVTLTGYLGRDPEIRQTREKIFTRYQAPQPCLFEYAGRTIADAATDLLKEPVPVEAHYHCRDYAVLSLASHRWQGRRRITNWHRVIVWNVDRLEHLGVRIARKGSRVEITGRKTTFTARDGRQLQQIELSRLRILRLR